MEKKIGDVMTPGLGTPETKIGKMRQALQWAVKIARQTRALDDIAREELGEHLGGRKIGVLLDELLVIPDEAVLRAVGEHREDRDGQ